MIPLSWGRYCILIALLPALGPSAGAQGVVLSAPPGFAETDEDDRTIIDVMIEGKRVAQTPARFNDTTLTFEDPEGLAAILPAVRDRDLVTRALARPLPTHTDVSCSIPEPIARCGYVYPDDVALIFDAGTLEAELFINDRYTYGRDARARFLPPPTVSPGLITSFDTRTAYDFSRDRWVGSHNVRAIAGRGRLAVRSELFSNTNSQNRLTSLYATHSGNLHSWSAGLQPQQSGGNLSRSRQLLGVRWGTTLDTRLDKQHLSASTLEISVAQSATIEIQRDGQTLDVQQIEPGQRQLDTSRLPGGSYTVDLLITEGSETRTETRYFSASSQLPPSDTPQWYVELGHALPLGSTDTFINTGETPILSFGRHQRLGSNWAMQMDATLGDDIRFMELGAQLKANVFSGTVAMLASDNGTYGYSANGATNFGDWRFNGNYRRVDKGDYDMAVDSDAYDPFPNSFQQASVTANRSGRWGRAGLRGFYRESSTGSESWFAGPFVDLVLLNRNRWRLNMLLRTEWGSDRETGFLGVRLSKSFNRPHPVIQRAQLTSRVDSNLVRNRSTGDTSETTIAETELRSEIARSDNSRLSAFAGLRHEEELGARAGFNFSAPWIEARVDGRRNYQNQDTALIDLRSGFAVGGAGFSVAATRYESGVQMSVKGPEGNPVSVQVDRRSSATAESGKSAFVPLAGFSMYDVGIQPAKTRDVAYEQFTDRLIVYPGNIIQLARSVRPVTIIIGRLVHEDGTPVADAILQYDGTIGSTGADGYFQADGSPGDLVTARMAGHRSCEFTVPDQDGPVEIYFEVGELVCS